MGRSVDSGMRALRSSPRKLARPRSVRNLARLATLELTRRAAASKLSHALSAVLAAMLVATAVAAAPFAALTVTPAGTQQYDMTTGITTLPDGGSIVDQDTGVALEAQRIVYLAGVYVEAWGVRVAGTFGEVDAEELRIDLVAGVLTATGGLSLTREALTVNAAELTYHAAGQVAVFAGGVTGSNPRFQSERVLLDVASGDVLLDGEYTFEGGVFALQSPEGGGVLALRLVVKEAGEAAYDAATEPAPELLERFAPYL